jgi:hypothetical protein
MGWWMLFGGVFWLFLIVTIGWIAFQLLAATWVAEQTLWT